MCQALFEAWQLSQQHSDSHLLLAIDSLACPCRRPLDLPQLDRSISLLHQLSDRMTREDDFESTFSSTVQPPPTKRFQQERRLMQVRQSFLQLLLDTLLDWLRFQPKTTIILTNQMTQSVQRRDNERRETINDQTFRDRSFIPTLGDFFSPLQHSIEQVLASNLQLPLHQQRYQRLHLEHHIAPRNSFYFQIMESIDHRLACLWRDALLESAQQPEFRSSLAADVVQGLQYDPQTPEFRSALLKFILGKDTPLPLRLALSQLPTVRAARLVAVLAPSSESKPVSTPHGALFSIKETGIRGL